MLDGLRGYVALVSGLTEATAARAREVATAMVAQGGIQAVPANATAMAAQVAGLAEDLLSTASHNRAELIAVVRAEAERAVENLGVVSAAEARSLRRRIDALERELADLREEPQPSPAQTPAEPSAGQGAPAPPTSATSTSTKKASATTSARKASAKKSAAKNESATTSGKKASAKQPAATKASANKKPAAKKPAARTTASSRQAATKKSTTRAATQQPPSTSSPGREHD